MANHENVTFTYNGRKKLHLESKPTTIKGPRNFKYFRVVADIKVAYAHNPRENSLFDQSVTVHVPYKKVDVDGVGKKENLNLYKKVGNTWKIIEKVTITGDANGGVGTFVLNKPFDPPSGWGEE